MESISSAFKKNLKLITFVGQIQIGTLKLECLDALLCMWLPQHIV